MASPIGRSSSEKKQESFLLAIIFIESNRTTKTFKPGTAFRRRNLEIINPMSHLSNLPLHLRDFFSVLQPQIPLGRGSRRLQSGIPQNDSHRAKAVKTTPLRFCSPKAIPQILVALGNFHSWESNINRSSVQSSGALSTRWQIRSTQRSHTSSPSRIFTSMRR